MRDSGVRAPRTHELRCVLGYFSDVAEGRKRFEVRKDDRTFEVGDTLVLREWDDIATERYTGRQVRVQVTYLMPGGQFGVMHGYVVLGVELEGGASA